MPSLVCLSNSRFLLLVAALAFASAAQAAPILYRNHLGVWRTHRRVSVRHAGRHSVRRVGDTPQAAVLGFSFRAIRRTDTFLARRGTRARISPERLRSRFDTGGNVLAQGTFLASDGIFISVDNTNQGIGFGPQECCRPIECSRASLCIPTPSFSTAPRTSAPTI